jgi:hypothetical protein
MTSLLPTSQSTGIFYPSSDGEPLAETSVPLQLRLEIDGQLIAFYRENTGEKLLAEWELVQARQQAEERAEQTESEVERLKEKLRSLGVDPDRIEPE